MTTHTRLALLIGAGCILIVLVFGGAVYYLQDKYSYRDFYKRLETRVGIAARYNLEAGDADAESLKILREQHLERLDQEKEYVIELKPGETAAQVAANHRLPVGFVENMLQHNHSNERLGNTFYAGAVYHKNKVNYLVVVSAENYYATHHLIFLRNILAGCMFLIVLVVVAVSFYFGRQVFHPIKRIIGRVKQISTENIHLRLNEAETDNAEISEMITTFNDLLSRIETAFDIQKNFISNASHELGTPLTSIIGEADVALLKDRSTEEYKKTLGNIQRHAERLDQITKSLLFLAQTGYKGSSIPFERMRIDEVLWDTKGVIDKLNPANKIHLDLSLLPDDPMKLKVKGNRQLLQLAFANVLSNACKYSGNGNVMVYIASTDNHIVITVKDEGIGIPPSEIAFIYDPFFRASNTGLYEGYGIGLPLTRNVVHLHKGQLLVTSNQNKGTTVQIKLPIAPKVQ